MHTPSFDWRKFSVTAATEIVEILFGELYAKNSGKFHLHVRLWEEVYQIFQNTLQ